MAVEIPSQAESHWCDPFVTDTKTGLPSLILHLFNNYLMCIDDPLPISKEKSTNPWKSGLYVLQSQMLTKKTTAPVVSSSSSFIIYLE